MLLGTIKLGYIMEAGDNFTLNTVKDGASASYCRPHVPSRWSMVLLIGMGKASACRMILNVVCNMNVDIKALKGIDGILNSSVPHGKHT